MSNRKEYHVYYHGKKESQSTGNGGDGLGVAIAFGLLLFMVLMVASLVWQAMVWCWHVIMLAVHYVFVVPWQFVCLHWVWCLVIGGSLILCIIIGEMED